jgi:hypothetical protein
MKQNEIVNENIQFYEKVTTIFIFIICSNLY